MSDESQEKNSKGAVKGEVEKKVEGTIKKTVLKLLLGYCCTNYFLVIFFAIVILFSVFVGVAPGSEPDETPSSPTGLCVPLKGTDPTSATATNITNYSNNPPSIMHPGAFLDMGALPASADYIKASGTLWGQPELVSLLEGVASEWNKKHPSSKMSFNDMSSKTGGQLGGHASHQVGVDVDISSNDDIFMDLPGGNNVTKHNNIADNPRYNPEFAIELGKLFFDTKSIIYIFYNDSNVSTAVNSYATSNGLPGNMQFASGHENHFHLRIDKAKYRDACGY